MSSDEVLQRYQAAFSKVPGTLTLTRTHIAWVPNIAGAMDRQNQAMSRVINMLASKEGSPRVSLKILFKDDLPKNGLLFAFTGANSVQDRKAVQDTLIPFVTAARTGVPASSSSAGPSTPTPGAGTPKSTLGKRKAGEGEDGKTTMKPRDVELRKKVLKKNPNLALLHQELVIGKQITEAEFWDGREALLQAEEMAQAQKPGRASRLLDDRFDIGAKGNSATSGSGTGVGVTSKSDTGPQIINLSRELMREIFEEFPVVQDAHVRYVPEVLSEAQFWTRYFQSQLWERQRASTRQSAVDETLRKKDDIFDQYLEDPDWNLEPRIQQEGDVERFLDLAATEEDHGETTTQRDYTMQAGRERVSLPLIRRFNEHSNKLLKRAGQQSSVTNGGHLASVLPSDVDIYNEIDYEDLRGPAAVSTIELNVQDSQDKDDDDAQRRRKRGIMPDKSDEELVQLASRQHDILTAYLPRLSSISLTSPSGGWEKQRNETNDSEEFNRLYSTFQHQRLSGDAAAFVIRDLYLASNAENAVNTPLVPGLLVQIKSCHNAASEFLRQYWSVILPPAPGTLGPNTLATKAAKAEKMTGYLKLMEGKFNAVMSTATIAGIDPERVRAMLSPTIGAVNVALAREKVRTG